MSVDAIEGLTSFVIVIGAPLQRRALFRMALISFADVLIEAPLAKEREGAIDIISLLILLLKAEIGDLLVDLVYNVQFMVIEALHSD
jgi:hypothetical protein